MGYFNFTDEVVEANNFGFFNTFAKFAKMPENADMNY